MNELPKNTAQEKLLIRIAHYLILHSSFTNNIGLLNGKMGIAIFFYNYANYTAKKLYTMFAGELIDEIYINIRPNYPFNFADGLCGIGWGIEYLVRKRFVIANTDEVLVDIDNLILEKDVRRINDVSVDTGLQGIAYYVLSHCQNEQSAFGEKHRGFIIDLIYSLRKHTREVGVLHIISQLDDFLRFKKLPDVDYVLAEIIDKVRICNEKNMFSSPRPLGIYHGGFAGIALKIINN